MKELLTREYSTLTRAAGPLLFRICPGPGVSATPTISSPVTRSATSIPTRRLVVRSGMNTPLARHSYRRASIGSRRAEVP